MKKLRYKHLVFLLSMLSPMITSAQEMPPKPISAGYGGQNLCFGAFIVNMGGGAVTLTPEGIRSSMGNIILINQGYSYFPAIFQISGNPGAIVHILFGPNINLTGSNGGTLTLDIGPSYPADPIILPWNPPGQVSVYIGGTLIVGNPSANPGGLYSGVFLITFVQE